MLFEPFLLEPWTLENRIVRSATAERLAKPDGSLGPEAVEMYRCLALGGSGMIITGHMAVLPEGRTNLRQTGIFSDRHIKPLKAIVAAVKKIRPGLPIISQISSAGCRISKEVSASAPVIWMPGPDESVKRKTRVDRIVPDGIEPEEPDFRELRRMASAFGDAAARARDAGFDGVQVHAAHGFFISQTLSHALNRREDEWGGFELERRGRFLREVLCAIRDRAGSDYPVVMKINCSDFSPGGLDPSDSISICREAVSLGVRAIEVSGGTPWSTRQRGSVRSIDKGEAYFSSWSRVFKKMLSVPVMLVGGIRSLGVMNRLLDREDTDLLSLCRPLIREPDLPLRWMRGEKETADCTGCCGCLTSGETHCSFL